MLYRAHRLSDRTKAEQYLSTSKRLMADIIKECCTPEATLEDGQVDFGDGGWETILQVSHIYGVIGEADESTPRSPAAPSSTSIGWIMGWFVSRSCCYKNIR